MEKSEFNELLNLAFKNRVETIRKPDRELIKKQDEHIAYLENDIEEYKNIIGGLKDELSTYKEDSDTLTFVLDHITQESLNSLHDAVTGEPKFFICCDELGEIMKSFETFLGPFMNEDKKCKDC